MTDEAEIQRILDSLGGAVRQGAPWACNAVEAAKLYRLLLGPIDPETEPLPDVEGAPA